MKIILTLIFAFSVSISFGQERTDNIILITLDGLRWQEVFNGADPSMLQDKKLVKDSASNLKMFGGATLQERREKLIPFFWQVIAKHGQVYGNRSLGNMVNVSNQMWFSYPGYNEILTGAADDARVKSNDKFDNPNKNVLEFIQDQKGFNGKVAAFTSWEVFPWIINSKRNNIAVNSGLVTASDPGEREKLLNELMPELSHFSGNTRLDAFTFHYALEYLKKNKPRALYLSFDETDHFAHTGEYDKYLSSAQHIDGFIRTLWEYLQSEPQYKNKTTLIITTDHGRGNNKEGWKHHGKKIAEADQIWFGFLGPDTEPLGEIDTDEQLYQNQLAKTIAAFLGFDFINDQKNEGGVIKSAGNFD